MVFKTKYASIEDVLANTTVTATGCMEWNGAINKDGYAACNAYGLFKSQALHREVHRLSTGETPEVVMHACDNRKCVNPAHLLSGTHETNLLDKVTKNRQAKGEANGRSKLTAADVLRIRARWDTEKPTYKTLGDAFGVSKATIQRVLAGTHWGHVCR